MKKLIAVFLVLNNIFLTGCWDMREINDLGLVMAVGVDRDKKTKNFVVTAQIARPSAIAGGKTGGGGELPVWIGSAEGKTIFEAVRNLAKFSSRRVMWAHNNIVIIGQSLAEEDITPVMDFFVHNAELRMKTWIAVAHGDAKTYVAAQTGMESIPAISLAELFRYHELPAESVASDMLHVFSDFKSESRQPLLSALREKKKLASEGGGGSSGGQGQIELAGAAVFKDRKMVGVLTPEDTRGVAWVRKDTKKAVIAVTGYENEEDKVSVEIKNSKLNIGSSIKGQIPAIDINLKVEGVISEQDTLDNTHIDDFKAKVEKLTSEEITREIRLGVDKVQKDYKSDILGFGRVVHIEHKKEWYGGLKEKWNDIFPQVPVNINVETKIKSSVLFEEPIKLEKETEQSGGKKKQQ